jgi:hypothetical protein
MPAHFAFLCFPLRLSFVDLLPVDPSLCCLPLQAAGAGAKTAIELIGAGVQVAKEGYEVAAPVIKQGVDAVAPVVNEAYKVTTETAAPLLQRAAPVVSVSRRLGYLGYLCSLHLQLLRSCDLPSTRSHRLLAVCSCVCGAPSCTMSLIQVLRCAGVTCCCYEVLPYVVLHRDHVSSPPCRTLCSLLDTL